MSLRQTYIPLASTRLISASVGTVVYYGFQCRQAERDAFLLLCLAVGVSGSIVPFTNWFNQREYKVCPPLIQPTAAHSRSPCPERTHRVLPRLGIQQHRPTPRALPDSLRTGDVRVHLAHRALARVVRRRPRLLRDPLRRVHRRAAVAVGVRLAGLAWRGFACDLARVHRAGD